MATDKQDVSVDRWEDKAFDTTTADKKERIAYVKHKKWYYESEDMMDHGLWEQYREDFADWTLEQMKEVKDYLRYLRITLRTRGVWINHNDFSSPATKNDTPESMYATLLSPIFTQWDLDEVDKWMETYGAFKSRVITLKLQRARGISDVPGVPQQRSQDGGGAGGGNHNGAGVVQVVTPPDPKKQIMDLTKIYKDEDKYGGTDDNWNTKLAVFDKKCDIVGITDEPTRCKAFSIMLKGEAEVHFNMNDASRKTMTPPPTNQTFAELCKSVREYFETPEYHRNMMARWSSLTLQSVIDDPENSGKSIKECFSIFFTEIRRVQLCLPTAWKQDNILIAQMMTACQPVDACSQACYNPPSEVPAFVSNIQNAIDTWQKSHPSSSSQYLTVDRRNEHDDSDSDSPHALYTDRQYRKQSNYDRGRNDRSRSSYNRNGGGRYDNSKRRDVRSRGGRDDRSPGKRRTQRCWICKKEGCYSTRHSKEEQQENRERYRKEFGSRGDRHIRQYIIEYEGIDPDTAGNDDDFGDFRTFLQDHDDDDPSFTFLMDAATHLADISLEHALTRQNPVDTILSSPPDDDNGIDPFVYAAKAKAIRGSEERHPE
jgi:hypothetical protein